MSTTASASGRKGSGPGSTAATVVAVTVSRGIRAPRARTGARTVTRTRCPSLSIDTLAPGGATARTTAHPSAPREAAIAASRAACRQAPLVPTASTAVRPTKRNTSSAGRPAASSAVKEPRSRPAHRHRLTEVPGR